MATDQSNRANIIKMLLALEAQIRQASALASSIQHGMGSENFAVYLKFRSKVDEIMSLSAIIERRIEDILELDIKALSHQFLNLNAHALTMLVRSNKGFFGALAERRAVPIGIRDVLAQELKFLDTVRERLEQPNLQDQLDQRIFEDMDDVMTAIRSISDRTTSLEDFTNAPSLSEWTGQARIALPKMATNKVRR